MADKKISALTASTTPLVGTEVLPIVQSGSTVKVAVSDLTAGRAISAGNTNVTLSTIPTNGIYNPSANTLGLSSNSTGRAYITATGDFGIAETNPEGRLALVAEAARPSIVLRKTSESVTNPSAIFSPSDNSAISITAGTTAGYSSTVNVVGKNDGYISFLTATTERMRISAAGDITASTGNLIIGTAGKGIDFSANTHAAGMTSELLTWYEEGNWTPTLAFGGASTGITYALQVGRYTRVGRTVSVQAYLQLSAAGSATGAMTIEGLPFASANVSNYVCIGSCALDNAATSQDQPLARLNSNSTSIMVMGGTATNNWFQWTDSGILSASLRVFVSLTYTV